MNTNPCDALGFNRREFLKGGSFATVMSMLGGVDLFAQTNAAPEQAAAPAGPKLKVAVIGLGPWGRELLTTLSRVPQADIAAICDNYGAMVRRSASLAPGAAQTEDYKTILSNKDIQAVIVATPTHLHKQIVLEAIKAGKHVYCEAPLAVTIEDAREIAVAAKGAPHLAFQAGLQLRSDHQRQFLVPFIRSDNLGNWITVRAQWHKKTSWRAASPNPEREEVLNWRLKKETSVGLVGELGIHAIDQATWFLNSRPAAVTGFGAIALHKDGREIPDTVHAVIEYAGGVCLTYEATLGNSFDSDYEVFYGSYGALMLRDTSAWLFKEVDSPLFGWEVYTRKELFYKETGLVLDADASKGMPKEQPGGSQVKPTPLFEALDNFIRNGADLTAHAEDMKELVGEVNMAEMAKVPRRASAGFLEGYQATVTAIKANEAILTGKRIELKPEWYELGEGKTV
jgi:predicted dehydrogenase